MNLKNIVSEVSMHGATLFVKGGKLALKDPKNKIDSGLRQLISENKNELVSLLNSYGQMLQAEKTITLRRNNSEIVPLSCQQESLWMFGKIHKETTSYNIYTSFQISGSLDFDTLQKSLNFIVGRHEVLRTVYIEEDGILSQKASSSIESNLTYYDLSATDQVEQEAELEVLIKDEVARPFDLTKDSMLRALLVKLGDSAFRLVVCMHHVASDAWSCSILASEFFIAYRHFCEGKQPPLLPLEVQYADFAIWQKQYLDERKHLKQLRYWQDVLDGAPSFLDVPTDYQRPTVQRFNGKTIHFKFDKEQTKALKESCLDNGVTLYILLMAGFSALLSKYSRMDDMVIGTTVAGRHRKEVESLIGFFANTLPLRLDLSGNPSVATLLDRVNQSVLDSFENQDTPYTKVVDAIQPARNLSHNPIFQVMFILYNTPSHEIELPGLDIQAIQPENTSSKFDMTLAMEDGKEDCLKGRWEYDSDLFCGTTIQNMISQLKLLLSEMVRRPTAEISSLSILTPADRNTILNKWNPALRIGGNNHCVSDIFQRQVEQTPNATAITLHSEDGLHQGLTYSELNRRANQLANYLRSRNVVAQDRIGIFMERSIDSIVALLAILKAGAVYLPIDTKSPSERCKSVIQDGQLKSILTHSDLSPLLENFDVSTLHLDMLHEEIVVQDESNLVSDITPDSLMYIMYTSGTTGSPNGVSIRHKSVVRLVIGADYIEFNNRKKWLQYAPLAFDASTLEIWGSLLNGAELVICPPKPLSPGEISTIIQEHQITTAWFTAPLFHLMVEESFAPLTSLNEVIAGGDVLNPVLVKRAFNDSPNLRIINGYGPTENTTFTCCYPMSSNTLIDGAIPIGSPIQGTKVYILDDKGNPVPVGVPGELCTSGDGIAEGYWNREELTRQRFTISRSPELNGETIYRTGDLVKWRTDGNIDYLGRIDTQIKHRGYRIELSEIESALHDCSSISQVTVLHRENKQNGEKRIVAYYSTGDGNELAHSVLHEHLLNKLPEYMLPSDFLRLDAFPVTANGKIDKKALPEPAQSSIEQQHYVEAETDTERKLAEIWAQVLGVTSIGVHDNFFHLGGHSLLGSQVLYKVRVKFNKEILLSELFERPTIFELAGLLSQKNESQRAKPLSQRSRDQPIPLSPAQERFWFLNQYEPNSFAYNVPGILNLTGELDIVALEKSLNRIIERHEILRTVFNQVEHQVQQQIIPFRFTKLPVLDLRHCSLSHRNEELDNVNHETMQHIFDLKCGPLIWFKLVRITDSESVLHCNLHHIICDGWSIGLIRKELNAFYADEVYNTPVDLPQLAIQYADFSAWQKERINIGDFQNQLEYWKSHLNGVAPLLELPTDRPRSSIQSYNGDRESFKLDAALTTKLKNLSVKHDVSLYMLLLTAYTILLNRYSRMDDIVVGTPIAGRSCSEVESLIGCFINTLALRVDLSGKPTFKQLLNRVKDVALNAYQNQDIPFESVVEALQPERNLSHTPIFQVCFVLQNTPDTYLQLSTLDIQLQQDTRAISKFDQTVSIEEIDGELYGNWEFNTDLFDKKTIQRVLNQYIVLLNDIVSKVDSPISELSLINQKQRTQLLSFGNHNVQHNFPSKCIHQLIEEQTLRSPNNIAVSFISCTGNVTEISYSQLNKKSNQFAHYLLSKGLEVGDLVGICMTRSIEMVICIIGTMKAGGVYVPLDPTNPVDRLNVIISESTPRLVFTNAELAIDLSLIETEQVSYGEVVQELVNYPDDNCNTSVGSSDLMYVIYTSGTTGKPKGVMVEHQALHNYLIWSENKLRYNEATGIPLCTSISFDFAITSLFLSLKTGKVVYLLEQFDQLPGFLKTTPKVLLKVTPSHLRVLQNQLEDSDLLNINLHGILVGGEQLDQKTVNFWKKHHPLVPIFNHYGPTETVVGSCVYEIEKPIDTEVPPIGKPKHNTPYYILDRDLNLCPIGVPGQIYVSGKGLARGYYKQEELTKEKFVSNVYDESDGSRLYATGDLAYWQPDGEITYVKRMDNQVKLRGYRIELSEIEFALEKVPEIKEAIVTLRDSASGEKYLAAYLTSFSENELDVKQLKRNLMKMLPEYMIPNAYVLLKQFPLTANRKLDYRALPEPTIESMGSEEYVEPNTEAEHKILAIWQDVLGISKIGIHDSFFEIGGNSLSATRVVSKLKENFKASISLQEFFLKPTISELGCYFDNLNWVKNFTSDVEEQACEEITI